MVTTSRLGSVFVSQEDPLRLLDSISNSLALRRTRAETYKSCIKYFGRRILPPVITADMRSEIAHIRQQCHAASSRLTKQKGEAMQRSEQPRARAEPHHHRQHSSSRVAASPFRSMPERISLPASPMRRTDRHQQHHRSPHTPANATTTPTPKPPRSLQNPHTTNEPDPLELSLPLPQRDTYPPLLVKVDDSERDDACLHHEDDHNHEHGPVHEEMHGEDEVDAVSAILQRLRNSRSHSPTRYHDPHTSDTTSGQLSTHSATHSSDDVTDDDDVDADLDSEQDLQPQFVPMVPSPAKKRLSGASAQQQQWHQQQWHQQQWHQQQPQQQQQRPQQGVSLADVELELTATTRQTEDAPHVYRPRQPRSDWTTPSKTWQRRAAQQRLQAHTPDGAATSLAAAYRGHLVRRMLRTVKCQSITRTILDSIALADDLRTSRDRTDHMLYARTAAQLQQARTELHRHVVDVFPQQRIQFLHKYKKAKKRK